MDFRRLSALRRTGVCVCVCVCKVPILTAWTQEKTIEFVEAYRHLTVLWDISLPEYKNNQTKLDALRGLAEKFNCDVVMLKKKIKNLRTAFRREHKSLKVKTPQKIFLRAQSNKYAAAATFC